jgi:uncharacterized protein with GYD domain
MLFVMWVKWEVDKIDEAKKLWKEIKFPSDVKVIGRYLLIGRHLTVVIFEAPSEEAILKITHPARNLGVPHVCPALRMEDALKMMDKM